LDTLEEALVDYVSDIPKGQNIQISKSLLSLLYNIYNVKEDIQNLDIRIQELKTCLENPNNSISDCVSKSFKQLSKTLNNGNEHPLTAQEPNSKNDDDLNKKAIEFYNALKDKFQFLRPPEERHVSRDKENVLRYLNLVEKLSEEEAQAIISKWEEMNLVRVDVNTNQIVSKDRDQEVNENGNQ